MPGRQRQVLWLAGPPANVDWPQIAGCGTTRIVRDQHAGLLEVLAQMLINKKDSKGIAT